MIVIMCSFRGKGKVRMGEGGREGVRMEAGEVEGDGGEVKGGRLAGERVPLMLAA